MESFRIGRRSVLKRLAGASALGVSGGLATAEAAQPAFRPSSPPYTFNVLIHGLWAIVVWQDHLELLAPVVRGSVNHVYRVGTLDWSMGAPKVKTVDVDSGSYQVQFLRTGPSKAFSETQFAVVQGTKDFNWQMVKWRVLLPLPTDICPLFLVSDPAGQPIVSGGSFSAPPPTHMPLTILLVYSTSDKSISMQPGAIWSSDVSQAPVNLHLWAEPANEPDAHHASQAFKALCSRAGHLGRQARGT
jgi:hypothetical protein